MPSIGPALMDLAEGVAVADIATGTDTTMRRRGKAKPPRAADACDRGVLQISCRPHQVPHVDSSDAARGGSGGEGGGRRPCRSLRADSSKLAVGTSRLRAEATSSAETS